MTTKHTPGPWRVEGSAVITFNGSQVADHTRGMNGEFKLLPIDEREANGALIAAAPDLLAALELLLMGQYNYIKDGEAEKESPGYMGNRVCGVSYSAMDSARAAIAKARG